MTKTKRLQAAAAALLLAALPVRPAAGQARSVEELVYPPLAEFEIPQPQRVVLDNGMVVILLEDHELPLIDAAATIHTGSRLEPAEKIGLAGLAGAVLRTGGTTSLSGDEIDDLLEGKAASIETSIGTESGSASLSCLKKDFPEVLALLADILRNPVFDPDKIEVARNQVTAGIARQNDNANQIMFREFREVVYGGESPYARSPTYDTVGAISRDDLLAWHAAYFHPNRVVLGLVGDFDAAEAVALVREHFGDWPRGPEPEPAEAAYRREPAAGVFYVQKQDMTQSNIIMGHLGIRRDNPDYYAVEVLNQVLSGSFASRLFSNVRSKKGLAYAVTGGVGSAWDHDGIFQMWMTTKTETTGAGIEALLVEARDLTAKPPTAEEVEKAKAGILNSFIFNSDSTREILSQQVTYEYYGYPLDWLSRYRRGIEAVTVEQVRAAAAEYVHPDRFSVLVVGPSEGRDRPLEEFGEVALVDISIPEPTAARAAATPAAAEAGERLVDLALEGLGGAERVDGLSGIWRKGSSEVSAPQGAMTVAVTSLVVYPASLRQEMVLPFGTVVTVVSPDDAFLQTPQGVQPLSESQLESSRKSMRRDPLYLLRARNEPGFEAVSLGTGDLDGAPVERLQVALDGDVMTLAIEPGTGRVLEIVFRGNNFAGAPGEVRRRFDDFRETAGLIVPFSSRSTFEGEPLTTFSIEEVRIDPEVEEGAFARPEAVAAGAAG